MGRPMAEDSLRKALTFGADRGVLLTDRFFAGPDTLATSYALSMALKKIREVYGEPMTKDSLKLYKELLDDSFVMKNLKKYKDMSALLHTNSANLFQSYPQLVSQAAQNFRRVDGTPKLEMEKKTTRSFIEKRSRLGLLSDAVKLAFAWR